jgi:hypothetical protein
MPHATFLPPDLGSFCRLDELGLHRWLRATPTSSVAIG